MNHFKLKQFPGAVCTAGIEDIAAMRKFAGTGRIHDLLHDESGQDLIEYALVAALVGLGVLGAARNLKNSIGGTFNSVGNSLTSAVS